jgi:hypothetical protein
MKLKMNLNQDFLASLFKVSSSLVSTVISTWISLFALELKTTDLLASFRRTGVALP